MNIRSMISVVLLGWVGTAGGEETVNQWVEPVTNMRFVEVVSGCIDIVPRQDTGPVLSSELRELGVDRHWYSDDDNRDEVCADSYWMAHTEVTSQQWRKVMGSSLPGVRSEQPVAGVTWHEAGMFAEQLSTLVQGHFKFRLPTGDEWLYACLVGQGATPTVRLSEDAIGYAWYSVEVQRLLETSDVGRLLANQLGMHDMLGNVWEWTLEPARTADNAVISENQDMTIRGGSYRSDYREVRCVNRGRHPARSGMKQIGFRLVRVAGDVSP